MTPQNGVRIYVSLLQIHAPIFQLFERNRQAGDRTAHVCAGAHDAKIAVEILDLGLARHGGGAIESIEHLSFSRLEGITSRDQTMPSSRRHKDSGSARRM